MEVAMGEPFHASAEVLSFQNGFTSGCPSLSKLYQWYIIVIAVVFTTAHTQDMADQEGDRARVRWTVPLVIGDFPARVLIASAVSFWSLLLPFFWGLGGPAYAVLGGLGAIISTRILLLRTVNHDKITFLIWNGWMTKIYSLPLLKILQSGHGHASSG
jgi:4-hydroxybenzoate polyprenyltransferase